MIFLDLIKLKPLDLQCFGETAAFEVRSPATSSCSKISWYRSTDGSNRVLIAEKCEDCSNFKTVDNSLENRFEFIKLKDSYTMKLSMLDLDDGGTYIFVASSTVANQIAVKEIPFLLKFKLPGESYF